MEEEKFNLKDHHNERVWFHFKMLDYYLEETRGKSTNTYSIAGQSDANNSNK